MLCSSASHPIERRRLDGWLRVNLTVNRAQISASADAEKVEGRRRLLFAHDRSNFVVISKGDAVGARIDRSNWHVEDLVSVLGISNCFNLLGIGRRSQSGVDLLFALRNDGGALFFDLCTHSALIVGGGEIWPILPMPVSHYRGSPQDPLRIPLFYALIPGGSAGDPPKSDTGIMPRPYPLQIPSGSRENPPSFCSNSRGIRRGFFIV